MSEIGAKEAAQEIGRLATRITQLASIAGVHVAITIKPAPAKARGEQP